MLTDWSLKQLLGYLETWSAVLRYKAQLGTDPVRALAPELARLWGEAGTRRQVMWPLHLLVGRRRDNG